jgi:TctA family transporter
MTISGANPVIFISSGICIALLIAAAILLLLPVIIPRLKSNWSAEENLEA